MDATSPAEVYPLDALISREERVAMRVTDWLYAVENNEAIKTSSRYVANRLQNIASSKDISRLKALKYILAIVDFNAALKPLRGGGKKLPPRDDLKKKVDIPDAVLDGMKRKFAAGSELTKWHIDKLITHAAALTLFVDNFETDVYDLREDLRLDNKRIHQYYRELGCKVSGPTEKDRERLKISKAEATQHHIAKLNIPPDFPKQRNLPVKRR
jgi:DNA-directed RNA polymerase I subunit RPA49